MAKIITISDEAWSGFRNAVAIQKRKQNATSEQKDTLALDQLRNYTARYVAHVATAPTAAPIIQTTEALIRAGTTVTDSPAEETPE